MEHPYSLRGYVPYGTNRQLVEERTNDIFAVVEFSGTQYKVTNVREMSFSYFLI